MNHTLWKGVLGEIELSVGEGHFKTWFKDTELVDYDSQTAVVQVRNVFAIQNIESRFDKLVKETLERHGINSTKVKYVVPSGSKTNRVNREITIEENDPKNSPPRLTTQASPGMNASGLNPRYTLENFIVGSSNDLAYTASQAVAANPGIKYNPLYFYGGVGLGKTHLMQAIGNEIQKNNPSIRVLYISTDTFINEFLDSIRHHKKGFANKYRNVDVLLVDDMQFIADKEKTQEEFFNTFNHLHLNNKQIIISSDKPPKSIPTLTERLRSRFEMGMTIDIGMPDFETRSAILATKASASGIELNPETIEYLANNYKTNIRELEGALNQLLAFCEMRGVEPDLSTAEGLLGNIRRARPQHLTSKQIIDKTAKHFGLKTEEICSAKRDKHIVLPRQIAMYLLRSELHMSFPKISTELGRKDHTTAIHSVEKIEKAIKLDFVIREQVASIREKLYA